MAKKTRAERLAEEQARLAAEADAIRALSSGTLSDAQMTAAITTPPARTEVGSTVMTPTQTRAMESDVVRAISGGTPEQAQQTIQRISQMTQPAVTETAPAPTGGGTTGGTTGASGNRTTTQTYVASDGARFTDVNAFNVYQQNLNETRGVQAAATAARKSAFEILREEFRRYGLESLITDSEELARSGVTPEEFEIGLRNSKAYKQRFSANDARINAGLSALSPAEYLQLEDAYQRTMRQYGLPASFYQKSGAGSQAELDKLISADVSPVELEERIQLAVDRVNNASPEVIASLEEFYPGVNKANLVAYVLDPQKALPLIQRQVRAAEIGAGARQAGLGTNVGRAEQLAQRGLTGEQAREGFQQIAGGLERGSQLASIYGESPYTQQIAEEEIFSLGGAQQARRQRQRIIRSEEAAFGGQTGLTGSALARDRAGSI
jgi:hypothetical protein